MVIILILATILITLISIWYALYFKYEQYLKQYPGPTPIPLVGHALHYGSVKKFLETSLEFHRKYGPTIKVQIAHLPPVLETVDPKFIEGLLGTTKFLTKSNDYKYTQCWLGTGLLTSGPAKWRKHRKILTPAFHFQILEQFIDTFNTYSDVLVGKMKNHVGKDPVDIYPFITLCSLDIICATSMGTQVNAQKDGTSKYVRSVKEMSRILMERILSIIAASDLLYSFTRNYRAQGKALKILHDYTNSVIASRKKEFHEIQQAEKDEESDFGIKKRNTFLDTLLKYKLDGGTITDDEIRQEVDTFMFEGHDTTSSAVSFILYSLANNPEIQQKAVEELRLLFGDDKERAATSKDLHEMKYLEMVIKESLRLYPPVPIYGRGVEEDAEYDGTIIPKGVTFSVFAYGVHRDPNIYPDPEKFDPERFTLENSSKRSPYAYIPFSAGPRNCIGQRFAMLEMKAITSKVLRNFELLPVPGHKLVLEAALILNSSTGTKIFLQERRW